VYFLAEFTDFPPEHRQKIRAKNLSNLGGFSIRQPTDQPLTHLSVYYLAELTDFPPEHRQKIRAKNLLHILLAVI